VCVSVYTIVINNFVHIFFLFVLLLENRIRSGERERGRK